MARLVITKGPGTGRDVTLGADCVVGRAPDVEVVLEDGGVSRRHCRVRQEGAAHVVEDLGSRNGTYVNGARIVQVARLADGDRIRVGGVEMVYREAAASGAPAVPAAVVVGGALRAPAAPPSPPPAAPAPEAPARKAYEVHPRRRRTGW